MTLSPSLSRSQSRDTMTRLVATHSCSRQSSSPSQHNVLQGLTRAPDPRYFRWRRRQNLTARETLCFVLSRERQEYDKPVSQSEPKVEAKPAAVTLQPDFHSRHSARTSLSHHAAAGSRYLVLFPSRSTAAERGKTWLEKMAECPWVSFR